MNKQEQIVTGFRELYNKMAYINNYKMKDCFEGYTSSEVHCIEYIGSNEDPNVTKLAAAFFMTRGAISKMAKKLMKKDAIESYKKSDNKKEIYFRLTSEGEKIYKIHEKLHKGFEERDSVVFKDISEKDIKSMIEFIDKYSKHLDLEISKLGIDLNP